MTTSLKRLIFSAASIIVALMSVSISQAQQPLSADSLPQAWSYTSDRLQEIPGGSNDHWWSRFSDPTLDSLIVLGIERNYDLKIASRRQEMARAAMNQARATWYPTIGLSAGWTAAQSSGANNRGAKSSIPSESYFNAGLNASWEIDLFGKVASGVKAKKAQYNATRAEYAGAMVSMTAQIASTYFTLRSQQRQLQVAKAHCESQMKIVNIAKARYEASLASKLDVAQAWQTYYTTASTIPMLESSIHASINSLGILIGEFPPEAARMLAQPGPLPNWKINVNTGVPADLLRRRPDIVEAEMQLAAAAANLGVAKKDFLPTLTIEGSIGTAARRLDNLFGSDSFTWSVAPTLSWTLFDGFARKYSVVSAREEMQSAIDSYNLSVLNAVGETESALSTYDASLRHIDLTQQLCVQNQEALRLAIERYKDSLSPMTDVVNAQVNALAGETQLIEAQASALTSLVSLYEALGGGIDPQ